MPSSIPRKRYKKNIIHRLGGTCQYEKLIIEFCEQLIIEPKLKDIFGCVHVDGLCQVQRKVLDLALVDMVSRERESTCTQVLLYQYRLFSRGFNSTHFQIVKKVLLSALRHTWADQDVINDVLEYFEELRCDFFCGSDTFPNFVLELENENERHVRQFARWLFKVSLQDLHLEILLSS